MMKEIPPRVTGNAARDVASIRDYLVRLAGTLDTVQTATAELGTAIGSGNSNTSAKSDSKQDAASAAELKAQAAKLKALILKTADEVTEYVDGEYTRERSRVYLASSDFGSYLRSESTYIQGLAQATIENYDLFEAIERDGKLASYYNQLTGYIRRGIVTDPMSGDEVIGIAIAQDNIFTEEKVTDKGTEYYRIASGQTFGLYTSTGWQFWISGYCRGYFNSTDGMLHVAKVYVEQVLQISDSWQLVDVDGLGIRYTGK